MSKKTKKKIPVTAHAITAPIPLTHTAVSHWGKAKKPVMKWPDEIIDYDPFNDNKPAGPPEPVVDPNQTELPIGVKSGKRRSICGHLWPLEPASDWSKFQGIEDWVHRTELDWFNCNYVECAITKNYVSRYLSIPTVYETIISKEYAQSPEFKKDWLYCAHSGHAVKKVDTIEINPCAGIKQFIWKEYVENYVTCDVNGGLFASHGVYKVNGHPKYKCVSQVALNNNEKNIQDEVGYCNECSTWNAKTLLKDIPDYGLLCDPCAKICKVKNSIFVHNAPLQKGMVKMQSEVTRLGHKVDEAGLVWSTGKRVPNNSTRLLGVEIETELHKPAMVKHNIVRQELAAAVRDALGHDFAYVKEDGSLVLNGKYDGNTAFDPDGTKNGAKYAGFEIVSTPADLGVHRSRWMALDACDALHYGASRHRYLRSWDTETCAMHVHISKNSLTNLQQGRMLRFINHPNNFKLICKIAGRNPNKYCHYEDHKVSDILYPERVKNPKLASNEQSEHNIGRRVALNVKPKHTVEFRIFRGTVNPTHILRNLEFCDAVCDFCYPGSRSIMEMEDYKYFVQFVSNNRKRWPLLASWFAVTGIIELKPIKRPEKAQPSKLTLKAEVPENDFDPDKPFLPAMPEEVVA